MSFLAPFYLLAGLAIGLPIAFHLIRQSPKGKQVFSSIMFLEPSPPRVTHRSRIQDWILLLLRALAVLLLALAFARPFLRSEALAELNTAPGRRIVFLVDVSGSAQRKDYWSTTKRILENRLGQIRRADSVSVITFADETETILTFREWNRNDFGLRRRAVMSRMKDVEPTWASTNLGAAMIEAAERLNTSDDEEVSERLVVVISDLQSGSHWEELNGYEWPEQVLVEFERVGKRNNVTNAAIQVVADDKSDTLRVRISNTIEADKDLFELQWQDVFGGQSDSPDEVTSVYVPPGQSRVVVAPEQSNELASQRLVISGDEEPFDNICYVAKTAPWQVKVLYLGSDNEEQGLRFFLKPALPSTKSRQVKLLDWNGSNAKPDVADEDISLVIVGGELSADQLTWARTWTKQGGQLVFVARDSDQALQLYELLELGPKPVAEAESTASKADYAMLEKVDLTHTIFQQFDDPRFSDFTKLKFWKHRQYVKDSLPRLHVMAEFDDGFPAIAEIPVEKGRVVLFASGWNRDDSEWAVSTKFVPMMNALLEYGSGRGATRPQYHVTDTLTPKHFGILSENVVIEDPVGDVQTVPINQTYRFAQPGIYRMAVDEAALAAGDVTFLAVNMLPEESQVSPLSLDVIAANGVQLVNAKSKRKQLSANQRRQLMNEELESRQQLWKWLLVGAGALLLSETLLGGWLAYRRESV